jgi:two-component system response regulator
MDKRPILLVEDNPDDQALALRAIQKSQSIRPVIIAADGIEALSQLRITDERPSTTANPIPLFVLLDLQLLQLDGLEVLRRIRAAPRTAHVPVIILTSSREDRDRSDAYRLGANSYVCKPVDFTQFVAGIQQIIAYWSDINEPPPEIIV